MTRHSLNPSKFNRLIANHVYVQRALTHLASLKKNGSRGWRCRDFVQTENFLVKQFIQFIQSHRCQESKPMPSLPNSIRRIPMPPPKSLDWLIQESIERDIDFSLERKYESLDPGIKDYSGFYPIPSQEEMSFEDEGI